jgi:hypothetical protein
MAAPFPRLSARAWLPALTVLVVHVVLWKGTSAYEQIPTLDRATHFLGGVTAAWFLLCCVRAPWGEAVFGKHSQFSEALCLLAWVGFVVVAWEFLEWSLDAIGLTRSQRSVDDTIADLALGMFGGGVIALGTRTTQSDQAGLEEMLEEAESCWSSEGLPGKRVMIAEAPTAVSMPFCGEPFGLLIAQFGEPIEVTERGKWVDAIIASPCALTAAWGAACSAWDDEVDHALVAQNLDRGSDRFIMTTWHEQETLAEALEFFFRDAFGENGRPHYYAILVFGASSDQLHELRADCLVAMEALS